MHIFVGGEHGGATLADRVRQRAAQLARVEHAPEILAASVSARSLVEAPDVSGYLDRLLGLAWHKTGVSTVGFYMPRKPGCLGSVIAGLRRLLWKLLRYQHDRIAWQQNLVNAQLTSLLEFMREEYRRDIDELTQRIRTLEADKEASAPDS